MPPNALLKYFLLTFLFGGTGIIILIVSLSYRDLTAFIIGSLFTALGFIPLYIDLKRQRTQRKVKSNGIIIKSEFLNTTFTQLPISEHLPLIVHSQWIDETQHLIYQFRSEPLSIDIREYLLEGLKIPVVINPANPKEYYMDLTAIPELKRILDDND